MPIKPCHVSSLKTQRLHLPCSLPGCKTFLFSISRSQPPAPLPHHLHHFLPSSGVCSSLLCPDRRMNTGYRPEAEIHFIICSLCLQLSVMHRGAQILVNQSCPFCLQLWHEYLWTLCRQPSSVMWLQCLVHLIQYKIVLEKGTSTPICVLACALTRESKCAFSVLKLDEGPSDSSRKDDYITWGWGSFRIQRHPFYHPLHWPAMAFYAFICLLNTYTYKKGELTIHIRLR